MVPGIYKGRPIEAVLACTESNKEYIGVTFEVSEGEHEGARITAQLWMTEKAEKYSRATLEKLGWTGNAKNVNGAFTLELPDTAVPFCVKTEEYNGRTSLKVDWIVNPPYGVKEGDKLSGRAAQDLLTRIKGEKANGRGNGAANGNGRGQSNGYAGNARQEFGPGADDVEFGS
jgi:hypothetical protein